MTGGLCLVLGVVGAHRLYVGKRATGWTQFGIGIGVLVLVATMGLSMLLEADVAMFIFLTVALIAVPAGGIWVLVDFLCILLGKFTDADGKVIRWTEGTQATK